MSYFSSFRNLVACLWVVIFISVLMLALGRSLFLLQAVDASLLTSQWQDVLRAFWMGGRFDLKIIVIAYAPLLLFIIIFCTLLRQEVVWRYILSGYTALVTFLLVGGAIGNYYYFMTFGNHFDVFIFGLLDDDTSAVLASTWSDYPIIRSVIFATVCGWLMSKLAHTSFQQQSGELKKIRPGLSFSLVLVNIIIFFIFARGTLGSLPLKRYHVNVSEVITINKIVPNAYMALDWARSDYKKQARVEPIDRVLVTAQMEKVLGQPTPEYSTPYNSYLANNSPHVVMAMMEGFGLNVLIEDDATSNDLLGELRPHFDQDYLFTRFLAASSATIDSIVAMLVHSDVPTISHSTAQNIPISGSAVLPYKRAGYRVVFVYGGNGMWRNLSNYLPYQGFDQVYDENSIIEAFPDAKKYADTWGVPDHYTYQFVRQLLNDARQPTMVFIMSVTNHSPFRVPDNYQPKPVVVSERMTHLLGPMADQAQALLETYQYANDEFGQFVSGIKNSLLAEKTVIAATGDHRVRYLAVDSKEEFALTHGVPFYLYVPGMILANTQNHYDSSRIGSHRDIFPTLYHYSLSNQNYISLGGDNLLSGSEPDNIGVNLSRIITQHGAFDTSRPEDIFPWVDLLFTSPEIDVNPDARWANEYRKLQNYYFRSQLMH
ncbi:sulfatase-like hydrolase/transferase [Vibrio scophthalmi]|uniref:Sulfatase N-terminal domain-containing protein n=1 Tax=Vibrio scophthalmi TaxID=45658 RepID=A0A1C7FCW1_9VIBR|nr:alkaline phosphatase family protein [Vibrio scophthalmi]ANU37752.1 hypothetical protein VSVS05_02674 [Vibrio scophthalmi]